MSSALEKNRQALEAVGGAGASPDTMRTARIGIWAGDALPGSAGLIAEALGDLLGRFWHCIDAGGGGAADAAADAASLSAQACGTGSRIGRRWDPPYDFAVGIGAPPPPDSAKGAVAIGADGWKAGAGSRALLGSNANPSGPLAAAALASAEAFKSVFAIGAERGALPLPASYEWDAWYGAAPAAAGPLRPPAPDLDLGEVHAFGIGAVAHALLWILERWPGRVTGTLHLVDPDAYDAGNPQRYMGAARGDIGRQKASAAAARLRGAHPGLDAVAHDTDMNDYFTTHNPGCLVRTALCGLDSGDARRQLGLKLPLTIVNMWTSEFHAGASTFSLADDAQPCILCAYPDPAGAAFDEAAAIHGELGLPPPRARELLDSGRSITESDARIISAATGARAGSIQLKPVRSIRTEMCATGRIAAPRGRSRGDVHVPLAFASAMAGAAGFTELVRAAGGAQCAPGQFQTSVLRYPTPNSWTRRGRSPECRYCPGPVRQAARAKHAPTGAAAEAAAQ